MLNWPELFCFQLKKEEKRHETTLNNRYLSPVHLSVHLSPHLSVHQLTCPSVCPSVCPYETQTQHFAWRCWISTLSPPSLSHHPTISICYHVTMETRISEGSGGTERRGVKEEIEEVNVYFCETFKTTWADQGAVEPKKASVSL